jgi:hypothetical protein
MNNFPPGFEIPLAISSFQARAVAQRTLQRRTFDGILVAYKRWVTTREKIELGGEDLILRIGHDEEVVNLFVENSAHKALYEDLGASLVLIAAASIERLQRAIGGDLFVRGVLTYADGVYFSSAIRSLANQYKHFGQWIQEGPGSARDVEIVTKLVDEPLRPDAASEFVRRCGFSTYEEFEVDLLSCSAGIAGASIVPDGANGIATVHLRLAPPSEPGKGDVSTSREP